MLKLEIAAREDATFAELEASFAAGATAAGSGAARSARRHMSEGAGFDPHMPFEVLAQERVSYVVVVGLACVVHGSGETTAGL